MIGPVVIIDDEEDIIRLVELLLKREGIESCGYTSGEAAAKQIGQAVAHGKRFSLWLIDLTLPGGMSGPELLTQLNRIQPGVPSIATTGCDLHSVREALTDFTQSVQKPFALSPLLEMINRLALRDDPGELCS